MTGDGDRTRARCGYLDERLAVHGGCGRTWTVTAGAPLDPDGAHRFCAMLHQDTCGPCQERARRPMEQVVFERLRERGPWSPGEP